MERLLKGMIQGIAATAVVGLVSMPVQALTLTDGDATAEIDQTGGGLVDLITNSDGLGQLVPDSPDHADRVQWFVGNGGANPVSAFDVDPAVVDVDLSYDLLGGDAGSGLDEWRAKLTNTATFTNASATDQSLDIYSYMNYDVTQVAGVSPAGSSETGTLGTFGAAPAKGQLVQGDTGAGGQSLSEVTTTLYQLGDTAFDGNADAGDLSTLLGNLGSSHTIDPLSIDVVTVGDYNSSGNTDAGNLSTLLGQLGNSVPAPDGGEVAADGDTLSRVLANAGLLGTTTATDANGGDDLNAAWHWNVTLAPGESVQITTVTEVIPEPASLSLLGIGMTILLGRRIRRR